MITFIFSDSITSSIGIRYFRPVMDGDTYTSITATSGIMKFDTHDFPL